MNDNYYIEHGYKLFFDKIEKIKIWIIPEFIPENLKNRFMEV
jgi:hypothetical protein